VVVPNDVLKRTAPTAVRCGLSHGQHVTLLASFLLVSGADLDSFTLSYSSSDRKRKQATQEIYNTKRARFTEIAVEENYSLFLHSDTKSLTDSIGDHGARLEKTIERLAVVITSPCFDGDEFVAAPGLENGTGRAQAEAGVEAVDDLGVLALVDGVVFDTTFSNSGAHIGTVTLVENELGRQILKLPCRHHISDLYGKNTAKAVSGRISSGPGDVLFLRYKREWPNLVDTIDYTNITKC
jgi:hypothetical protein